MRGIKEEKLKEVRALLIAEIQKLENSEKEASGNFHKALADKERLKAKLVEAKNKLLQLDALIAECGDISASREVPK